MSEATPSCTIHHGDCLVVLPTLPDNSVDLILTDPPYFKVKGDAWDRQWETPALFLKWLDRVLEQFARVLRPNGSLYLFASPKMAARVEVLIGERFEVIQRITWGKPKFSTKAEMTTKEDLRSFFPVTEAIIFAEKSPAAAVEYLRTECVAAGMTPAQMSGFLGFKPTQGSIAPRRYLNVTGFAPVSREDWSRLQTTGRFQQEYDDIYRPFTVSVDVPYTDVWDFPTVSHYPGKHPCEKPQALLRHVIAASSRPGAVVLDAFFGSGAVGEAALALGRSCIGIEMADEWVQKSRRRCAGVVTTPTTTTKKKRKGVVEATSQPPAVTTSAAQIKEFAS